MAAFGIPVLLLNKYQNAINLKKTYNYQAILQLDLYVFYTIKQVGLHFQKSFM